MDANNSPNPYLKNHSTHDHGDVDTIVAGAPGAVASTGDIRDRSQPRRDPFCEGAFHHGLRSRWNAWFFGAVDRYVNRLSRQVKQEAFTGLADGTVVELGPDPTEWGEIRRNLMVFEPVVDGDVLTARPIDRLAEGMGATVEVLIGSNAEEHALFLVPSGMIDCINEDLLDTALTLIGGDPGVVGAIYRAALPEASPGELLSAAMTDWFYRLPAVRLAEARLGYDSDTYVYEFCWRSPQCGGRLGACHGLEIGFAFDNLDDPSGRPMAGANPPQTLADEMHGAWVSFVKTGTPGWPAYGHDRNVRSFETRSTTVADPRATVREAWDGIR